MLFLMEPMIFRHQVVCRRQHNKGEKAMDEKLKNILENALNMPQEQRAFIAGRLIESLDDKVDEDVETAWQNEIQKRIASAEKGEATFMSWEYVKKRLKGE
jgi:putative addiction module component (TIGR02574 family)